jgi:hypothetical protein
MCFIIEIPTFSFQGNFRAFQQNVFHKPRIELVFRNILLLRALTLHLKKHFLPDQYRVKGLIVTFCIGWKSDNEDEAQGKIWEMYDR